MTGEPPSTDPAPPAIPPRQRRLLRRRDDRMVAGVASGMADYLDADPALVRIGWAALTLITGGLAAIGYVAAWVLVPEEPRDGDVPMTEPDREARESREERRERRRRERGAWPGVIWGAILVLVGVVLLLLRLDLPQPPWRALASGALILVGATMVVAARRRLHGGLLVLGIVLTVGLATSARLPIGDVQSGFGDRRVAPTSAAELNRSYGQAFGAMRIDLPAGAIPDGTTAIDTNIAFGDLRLTVPAGVGLRVSSSTAFGSTRVLDEEMGPFESDRAVTTPGYDQATKRLDIRTNTAFGATRIVRGAP